MGTTVMKVKCVMPNRQYGKKTGSSLLFAVGGLLLLLQTTLAAAEDLTLQNIEFSALPGDRLQLQLKMSGPAHKPAVFQTDNPARIVLDFPEVKSALETKTFPVNVGVTSSVHAVEAGGRLRVVVNLIKMVPFDTRVEGNQVFVTLTSGSPPASAEAPRPSRIGPAAAPKPVSATLPKQTISNIDFRRGEKGEGRLLVSLTDPNAVIDFREQGGKVVVTFMNTSLPASLSRRLDVGDFATPIQTIDSVAEGSKTKITVSPKTGDYDYSSYQTDGMLTVEFRPLTPEEKEEAMKKKFPYTGERLSLNFQDIEVRSVLQILADFTNLNIVAADSVSGNVTLRLNDVPWDQALDLILKSKGLSKRESGNVLMVAPTTEINQIEREELEAQKVVQQLEPLRTEFIQINYAKAENFRNLLFGALSTGTVDGCSVIGQGQRGGSTQTALGGGGVGAGLGGGARGIGTGREEEERFTLLSDRGTAIVDSRTNILIVRDTAKRLEEVKKIIDQMDKPVRQVLIEARVVIATDDFAKELGVRFQVNTFRTSESLNTGETLPSGPIPIGNDTISGVSGLVDLAAVAAPNGTLAVTLLKMGDYLLDLELTALQNEAKGEVVSNPRVMTLDRCRATIRQGVQIPFKTRRQAGDTGTTELVDAVLELNVTPQITPNGTVIMDLNVKRDDPSTSVFSSDGEPGIDKREVVTSVQVDSGDTVVLGGVYEDENRHAVDKVPFFADLPGIGFLFKRTNQTDTKRELLIFITPKIVKQELSAQ